MDKIFIIAFVVLAVGFSLFISDLVNTSETHHSGTVVSKQYTPASSGSGTGVSSSGKPVVVSTYEPEQWTLIVEVDGKTFATNASPSDWADAEKGMPVDVAIVTGNIFGSIVNRRSSLLGDKR